eukprot:1137433-Pelagomonas_calceolata.AAC.7
MQMQHDAPRRRAKPCPCCKATCVPSWRRRKQSTLPTWYRLQVAERKGLWLKRLTATSTDALTLSMRHTTMPSRLPRFMKSNNETLHPVLALPPGMRVTWGEAFSVPCSCRK